MGKSVSFVGDYEIHYMQLDRPFTMGVEYEVTIRLVRDGYGRTVVGPAAVFVAFGKTADEGLRNAERLVEARLAMQGNEGLLTR